MSDQLSALEKALEDICPWYSEVNAQSAYTVKKYVPNCETLVVTVLKGGHVRYLLQVLQGSGVRFAAHFPAIGFKCDGMPVIVYEAQRGAFAKDLSTESMGEVRLLADDEDLYRNTEQGVARWIGAVYSEIDKGMPTDVAIRVVNCDLGEEW
jgi:hypothetical protein